MESCQVCGEEAVIEDDGTDGCMQKVCADCGIVQSTSLSFWDETNLDFPSNSRSFCGQPLSTSIQVMLHEERMLEPKKIGIQMIIDQGSLLGLSQLLIEESKDLYTSTYIEFFMQRLRPFKLILATSCVYYVCRLHGHALLIRQVCDVAQLNPRDFSKVFKELCLKKRQVLPHVSAGSAISNVLQKSAFDNPKWLVNRTQEVLQLADKHWLVTGRSPEQLITAAIFISWLSQDFQSRRKTSLASFCKQRKYLLTTATKRRYTEFRGVLLKMSSQIPWLTPETLTLESVPMVLDDIIKYQKSILLDLVTKRKRLEEVDSNVEQAKEQVQASDKISLIPPSLKKPRLFKQEVESPAVEEYHTSGHDLDAEDLTENDIKDCDIIQYTKTSEEIKLMENIKRLKGSCPDKG